MGVAAQRLSKITNTVYTTFRIPTVWYLSCLLELNKVLDKIKTIDVIIIDKMSMMTSYVLCTIKQRLKDATLLTNVSPFQNKLVLQVGDLAQLPQYINIHFRTMSWYVPYWSLATQNHLSILVHHTTHLEYLQFPNIIYTKQPTQ